MQTYRSAYKDHKTLKNYPVTGTKDEQERRRSFSSLSELVLPPLGKLSRQQLFSVITLLQAENSQLISAVYRKYPKCHLQNLKKKTQAQKQRQQQQKKLLSDQQILQKQLNNKVSALQILQYRNGQLTQEASQLQAQMAITQETLLQIETQKQLVLSSARAGSDRESKDEIFMNLYKEFKETLSTF